ncbi:unnamed protein product [Paramecium pentaurelia]|uniref:Uncharacterized protein n=1 Tax=Paramecium pentaurelia TaxID=43138 RepID=A0A8S1SJ33_9CILI|nr:unnamed protein product [Paramecium pentaurelia]
MHLQLALTEDNQYMRLQKLSLGIKEFAQSLPNQQYFTNISSLKLLICAYPFQQYSVELIISILFDRFKDDQFISTFHQAISEVAQLQEQREFLSQRSFSVKSSRFTIIKNASVDVRLKQQNVSFAKTVIEKLLIAKKFSSGYLKQLFQQAKELNMDLEKMAKIFKTFIINTKDQEFRYQIISIFDICKKDIFGDRQWITTYYEEIEQYFLQNHIQNSIDFVSDKNLKINLTLIDDSQNYDSDDNQEDSIDDQIQKWLFETNTYDILERENIFKKPENYDEILKYITQPEKVEVYKKWAQQSDINLQNDDPTYYKIYGKSLKQEETIRSYKALQVLIKEDNIQFFDQFVQQNVIQIFNGVYNFINDQNNNMNLNHIAKLIEITLMKQPKLSIVQIVDLNLYFSLSLYIYNSMIQQILENIINIKIDYYQLGHFFQEQIWKYLCKTEWFTFIVQRVYKEAVNMNMIHKEAKTEAIINILSILKTLSSQNQIQIKSTLMNIEEKEQLTNLLGVFQSGKSTQQYYTTNQFNWQLNQEINEYISTKEFITRDLDNLNKFIQERKNNTQLKQYYLDLQMKRSTKTNINNTQNNIKEQEQIILNTSMEFPETIKNTITKNNNIIINTRKSQSKAILKLTYSSSQQSSSTQIIDSPYLESNDKYQVQVSIEEHCPSSFKRQQQKSIFLYYQPNFRQKTERNCTNDGFSSSKLKIIYPSYKTQISHIQYENQLQQIQIDQKYYYQGIILLLHTTKSIIEYLNNNKVKLTLSTLDISCMSKCFLSQHFIDRCFQIYLLNILENQPYDSNLSDECGIFINYIYENVTKIKCLKDNQVDLCNSFLNVIEYLCKQIFEMNKNLNNSTKHKFKKSLLMTTLNIGFQLFQLTFSDQIEKLMIQYINESVLHILVIWFFDSDSNNTIQRNFFMFLNLLLNKTHPAMISTLFFKIGLIQSLQNSYSRFYVNGIKNNSYYENLTYYIQNIIKLIQNVIHQRKLIQIQRNLETMQSWHIITENKYFELTQAIINNNIIQEQMSNQEQLSLNDNNNHRSDDLKQKEFKVGNQKILSHSLKLQPLCPGLPNKCNKQTINS